MKIVSAHIEKESQVWLLTIRYEGKDANVDSIRIFTWKFMTSTEALTKAQELFTLEQN